MKILVVEDDRAVAQSLQFLLTGYNYAVDIATDGESGLEMAEAYEYDLILLDVILPGLDGISLCQQLRAQGMKTPILLLTGQGGGHQKAIALNAGADDYVVKPFDTEELIARVQALLRRGGPMNEPILTWGLLSVEPSNRNVAYGTQLLSVTPKEYAILELMLRNPQKALSAKAILDHVWTSVESPGEEAVRVHIKELRQKFTAVGAPKDLIKTVHRVGYRLNPVYSSFLANQSEAALTTPQIAELKSVNEELRMALEQLRSTQAELRQKNQELEIAYDTIALERQQLQSTRDQLETRVAERTAELMHVNQFLQQQQTQWQALFEHALDAIVIMNDDGYYVDVNPAACKLFGVAKQTLLRSCIANFVDPKIEAAHAWLEFLAQGRMSGEFRLHRYDGTIRDTEFTAIANFVPGRHLAIMRDISDRKQAEIALKQSEEKFRHFAENSNSVIWIADPTIFHNLYASPAYESIWGRSRQSLIDQPNAWLTSIHPDDLDRVQAKLAQERQGQSSTAEYRIVRPDGSVRWIWDRGFAIHNEAGQIYLYGGIAEDITERKQVELELRQREAFLRSIYDGADQAIFVIDVDATSEFRYVAFNTKAEQFAGIQQQDIRDQTPEAAFGPVTGVAFRQNYVRCLQAGTSISYEEHVLLESHTIWTLTTLSPLRNEQGKIYRLVGTAIDISDRKQAELALQQQIRQEQLLADIAQDIRRSLNLSEVLSHTVRRVRHFLATDRVIIFRFRPDWVGDVMMESVGAEWTPILSTTIFDPCFGDRYIEPYQRGRISTISNVDADELAPCYVELLQSFQVKANLVVPILQGDHLWGLLIAHHCAAPRQWQPTEIALLRQLATQVGIAIQQSELYEQTRRELATREQMQAVLEEREERFRSLSAAAPIGILETNADGICLYANACWQTMSGLSLADSLGDGWLQAIHPDDRPLVLHAWDEHLHNQMECQLELRLLPPHQATRWVVARSATIRSATGETIGNVCIFADMTDRKLSDQKIREQAALLDITSDAIFVRDLEHRILYWNQGAERLYGWRASEAIGQVAYELLHNDPADVAEITPLLLQQGEWRGELRKVTQTGREVTVEARWTLVRDEANQPRFILSVDTDITEKKQLEAQFYRAQRLESLGTLASGIAHDLNNVLTPILGIAQLLRLKKLDLDPRSQEMLVVLEDSAKRGANMVKQILTFTRGTDGDRSPLQVAPIMAEVIQVVQQTFPRSITMHERVPATSSWLVSANPTHLHQVLMNLCVNARDAMPQGGVLSLSLENCVVDAAQAQRNLDAQVGNYVVMTIADTGTGIPPEVRDRMFDPFFTTKPPGQGTGLGLATVLGIVKNYGGFVQVSTVVGQGTTIQVYLPATEGIWVESRSPQECFHGNGEQVLIVDDDVAVQQGTRALLESHGYTTLVTNDGLDAIELYAQSQGAIDLVMLDIMMPRMSGIALIQRLRSLNPAVKLIAMSGLPANREPALAAGANVFLAKPYTLEHLLENLQTLLQHEHSGDF
ncbi:MAG: PAS domain S-box protein [Leptolyngbyaceae cyanobacterium bins.349]|nr:PAS domain S-box protein [Leptolyngbyaceae cyanobacterium bins.349]